MSLIAGRYDHIDVRQPIHLRVCSDFWGHFSRLALNTAAELQGKQRQLIALMGKVLTVALLNNGLFKHASGIGVAHAAR